MSTTNNNTRKVLWGIFAFYVVVLVALAAGYGLSGHRNDAFQIQNEFKLVDWLHAGVLSINRAVLYLLLAAILTVVTTLWISRRMQARPNKVQTAVEAIYSLMRDNITRGNMPDSMAAKWFPFLGALFLFVWWSNLIGYLPLPTNSEQKFTLFGAHIPSFALYAATANISVPLVLALIVFILFNAQGIRAQGPIGYVKSLIPSGVHGPMLLLIFPLEVISTFMRLISLTVRLFANILAGHMIILFMAGGLAVILGLSFLGWFTMPFAVLLYLFELGLVATLQAFIFATLAAIYIGGAVSHH
jgi:F-type H+-transporting ATPase subunit a